MDDFPLSSKFKWRIEKISELNQDNRFSPTFTVGPCKWRLLAFRRGSNADDYLSVYVDAVECTNSRYARFSLAVVGQTNNTFKQDTEDRMLHFTKEESDWGFDEFIRFNELIDPSNGYIVNDACTVEVELYSFSKQDSIKQEFLPMELVESGHSGMKFSHEKTKNGKKLAKDNSSAVQRSNWDKNEKFPVSSKSRIYDQSPPVSSKSNINDQSTPHPVSTAVFVTPKSLKKPDCYRKYSIDEIKVRCHLDERFEVEFVEGEDKLTDTLIKNFPYDRDNLLIAVGQLEAGLRLPLYYPENPFYYEVLSQRADKRSIFQYTGNFFRFLRECRKRSKGCTGVTSIVPEFRREDYTATNFNWTWGDNISVRNRFPWCVGPRRISCSQDQDFSGKVELLSEYKGKKWFDTVRLDHDEKWFRTPLRIKGPWVMGWLTSGDPRTSFEKYYPPYEPWTLNMVASAEVTSVPHSTDGTATNGDDPNWTTPLDTTVKRSRPDTLDVRSSSKNTKDVEISNVDDAVPILDTSTTSCDVGLCEKYTVNPSNGDASIPPVDPLANPPVAMNVVPLPNGGVPRVMEESTAQAAPFVNSGVLDFEAGDGGNEFEVPGSIFGGPLKEYSCRATPAVDADPASTLLGANLTSEVQSCTMAAGQASASVPSAVSSNIIASDLLSSLSGVEPTKSHMFCNPFVALEESEDEDGLMQSAMLEYESAFSSLARFGEYCRMAHKLNHAKFKDLATRVSGAQREKDLLASEVCGLKKRMQGLVSRADEADTALAKQIEATNGVQEQLTIANARIQELESLNQDQALQHAGAQLQLQDEVAGLKSQLKDNANRAKEFYVKWAKDQVNQAFALAESSGMMKPGEKFKRLV
ncbi:hypothetical protein MKX03_004291 [Papaver bracteatum]|nr:hypothetical protein MKX03_004291 [Papaver bracteatum]